MVLLPINIYSKSIDANAENYIQKNFTRLERHLAPWTRFQAPNWRCT